METRWLEVSVETDAETAEAVAEVLARYAYRGGVTFEAGPEGWESGPVSVRAYLPYDDQLRERRRSIEQALGHLNQISPVPPPTFRTIAEEDWAEAWKEQLSVLHVGERFVVRPTWLDYTPSPDEVVIELDPGMAFGTGLHPTTQMCLVALEKWLAPGHLVLDLGTGSGILAIAAARLGAKSVLAVDNDPVAVQVARENIAANGVLEVVQVKRGSLDAATAEYDLVLVNILAPVIVEMLREGLVKRLRPGGKVIATGIIAEQEGDVLAAMEEAGLALTERLRRDDWVCLVGTPAGQDSD